jgi:hypothetical protein
MASAQHTQMFYESRYFTKFQGGNLHSMREEITDSNKRRKLFNQSIKTVACESLERIVEREFDTENCLSYIICRNCVDKNTKLLHKLDLVRDLFHTVESTLIEKKGKLVTKRQNSNDKQQDSPSANLGNKPVKGVLFFRQRNLLQAEKTKKLKQKAFKSILKYSPSR